MANDMYKGCWPVAPTPFMPNGEIDKEGMKRLSRKENLDKAFQEDVSLPDEDGDK